MPKLGDIKGIRPSHKSKLKKANVNSINVLLTKGATPKGRAALQSDSGIDGKLILDWVNRADLLRIKGIGSEFSDLLVKAGIHTVNKLAVHKPEDLLHSLARKNSALGNQVGRLPGQGELKGWIQQARMLASAEPSGTGGERPGGGRGRSGKAGELQTRKADISIDKTG